MGLVPLAFSLLFAQVLLALASAAVMLPVTRALVSQCYQPAL